MIKTNDTEGQDRTWYVPINFATENSPNFTDTYCDHFLTDEESITINLDVDSSEWVIVNIQGGGFFRVNYALEDWELLFDQLESDHEKINTITRAQILDDSMNIARAGT